MDLHPGAQAAREGIRRARKGANPDWSAEMYRFGVESAREKDELTSADLRDLHDIAGKHTTSNWSALGAVMRDLARNGIIKATGKVIKSPRVGQHRRLIRVWKSLI